MAAITLEQLRRGIAAIDAHRGLVKTVYDAFLAAGEDRVDGVGGSGLANELVRQLEERCDDPSFPYGGGSMIEYMLYDGRSNGGSCTNEDPPVAMQVNSVDALWAWWQATRTGPFLPPAENGPSDGAHDAPRSVSA